MRLWRRGGVFLFFALVTCCAPAGADRDAGSPAFPSDPAGGGYVRCTALCLRPSDCATAYSSGSYCPPGFQCSTNYTCGADGGAG